MTWSMTADERQLVLAAHERQLILSSAWPDVAAQLVVRGVDDDDDVVALAGLSANEAYAISRLVPAVIELLGPPDLDDEGARLVARALAHVAAHNVDVPPLTVVRVMASWSPRLGYPSGVLGEAYNAEEYMECDCHRGTPEQDLAPALVARLLDEPLNVDADLLAVVTNGWLRDAR